MDAKSILNESLTLGVMLYTDSGKLYARNAPQLTNELRTAIKSHKKELLELLTPKRAIVRFTLINNQGSGVIIGDDTDTLETLIEALHYKYGNRLLGLIK